MGIADKLIARVEEELRRQGEAVRKGLLDELRVVREEATAGGWLPAVGDYGAECDAGTLKVLPPVVRYAMSNPDVCGVNVPMLLPTDAAAWVFDVGERSREVSRVMVRVMMRLLMCMQPGMIRVTAIDRDMGLDFGLVGELSEKVSAEQFRVLITERQVSEFMSQLTDEVRNTFNVMRGCDGGIDEYNANGGDRCRPYHLVLIDDFPHNFTNEAVRQLANLMHNGNARKAGVMFVVNDCRRLQGNPIFDVWNIGLEGLAIKPGGQGFLNYSLAMADAEGCSAPNWSKLVMVEKPADNLDNWRKELIEGGRVWTASSAKGISVPVGFDKQHGMFEFQLGTGLKNHALVLGGSGSGKTNLLHNIISNAALKYSPDELHIYMADFSGGASFRPYRRLPHVRALMAAKNKEFAVRMLRDISRECNDNRTKLYLEAEDQYGRFIETLSDYREVTGKTLPRILVIIDECQVLLSNAEGVDEFTKAAAVFLRNGIREWRKFGVSIILCTQTMEGVELGDKKQITYRLAGHMDNEDFSGMVDSHIASKLMPQKEMLMNDGVSGNVVFCPSWSEQWANEDRAKHIEYLYNLYCKREQRQPEIFECTNSPVSDLTAAPELLQSLTAAERNHQWCDLYLGKPDLLRHEHTKVRLVRKMGSNLLVAGEDYSTLVKLTTMIQMQLCALSPEGSQMLMVDCFNPGDECYGVFDPLQDMLEGVEVGHVQDTEAFINRAYEALLRRQEAAKSGLFEPGRVVLTIINAQDSYALRPTNGNGYAEQSKASTKLNRLLNEGPQLGIHCIVQTSKPDVLFSSEKGIDKDAAGQFDNIVFMRSAKVGYKVCGVLFDDDLFARGKMPIVEANGRVLVITGRRDYEQCLVYNCCRPPVQPGPDAEPYQREQYRLLNEQYSSLMQQYSKIVELYFTRR